MIEKLKPLAGTALGLLIGAVLFLYPEAKPYACGLALGVGAFGTQQ